MVLGIRNCPVARLHILNRCGATVTDGWCPTAALRTGAATVRPVCCFGLRGRTAPPRCCCSTARCGAIRAAPGACRAVLETATRRRNRPRSANRARRRACPPSDSRCGPRWSPPRCAGSTTRTGPTPPLSPMPGSCWTPCPTGKAPNCAGWPRTRWPTCRYIPDSPPVGNDCGPLRDRATGPVRRTAAAAAAHHSDRGRGFPLVYAGRRGSGALAAG